VSSELRPRQGQLYFAELEEIGQKLVLIVSQNEINDVMHPVVCLVTSTERERSRPTFVSIYPPEGGIWKPSTILCHALVTLETWRLAPEPIGSVSERTMDAVREKLVVVFGAGSTASTTEDEDGESES
jgi:mRNA-degrading endonuclease toxin of MazEF toxin-antitoxin module